jgi:purine-nucleoside phosphorylase
MLNLKDAMGDFRPQVGLVLGSGLGEFADQHIQVIGRIPYSQFAALASTTVPGHTGCFVWGMVGETPIVCMQGRLHFYEGHSMATITEPIRMLHQAGIKILVLTNAAGGIRSDLQAGDFMLLEDHINWMGFNPLIGLRQSAGNRFPDMTEVYDSQLRELALGLAESMEFNLQRGVYLATTGPSFETSAEIRAFASLGADAVGMSTVPEAIVARQCGLRVLGISCITNAAAGLAQHLLSHQDVEETATRVRPQFNRFMSILVHVLAGD